MYLLFLSSTIQTHVSKKVANYLSKQTHTPISIEGVNISPFKSVVLKGLYIEDYKKDTLIYIDNLRAEIDSFSIGKKQLYINKLSLSKTFFNLHEDEERVLNIKVFLDSISKGGSAGKTDSTQKPWNITVSSVDMRNSNFGFKTVNYVPKNYGINYDDIYVTDLNIQAQDIKVVGDSVGFFVKHLSCKEKSGFVLKDFKANNWFTSHQWGLSDVNIVSEHSNLVADHLFFNYEPNQGYWTRFTRKMQLDFLLKSSCVSFLDLAYFNKELLGFQETGYLSGKLYGTIYDLRGRDINIIYGKNTALKGKFYMNGLPNLRNSYLEADFKELTTSISDIEKVYIPGYSKEHFNLPDYFNNLGLIQYKGRFNGFINDFVFYGKFDTDLGNLKTDILFKPNQENNKLDFNGDLSTSNFNLGGLVDQKKIGDISLNVTINGFTSPGTTQGVMKGNISKVDFYDYEYKNLTLNGFFSESQFDGKVSIEDPNIGFDFTGKVDFSQEIPIVNFSSHLSHAKLFPLHLNKKDQKAELSLSLNANFTGNGFDNANGIIEIDNTEYKNSLGGFLLKDLTINSFSAPDLNKITLKSDISDFTIEGSYEINKLVSSVINLAYYYFPAYAPDKEYTKIDSTNNFKFNLKLKDTKPITTVLYPKFSIAPGTKLEGEISAMNRMLHLHFKTPQLKVEGKSFDELEIDLTSDSKDLTLKGRTNKFIFSDYFELYNFSQKLTAKKNKIQLDVLWNNQDTVTYSGFLSAKGEVEKSKESGNAKWDINLLPGSVIIADSIWSIPESRILIDSTSYTIHDFKIARENQFFGLDGKISSKPNDNINLRIQNISLKNLNHLTRKQNIDLNGTVKGYVQVSDFYGDRLSNSNVMTKNLILNNDSLGNLFLTSNWDKHQKKLSFSSFTDFSSRKELNLEGDYFPDTDSLNMDIRIDKMRMDLLNPYLQENISEIKGNASGNLNIQGHTNDLKSEGKLKFEQTKFMVNALKTTYYCNDSINIMPGKLRFDNLKLSDKNNQSAVLFGSIAHDQFSNFELDLSVNTLNFNILDTKESDNELFYGEAYVTGITHLYGPANDLEIEIRAKTDKNTRIYVPINNSEDIQESNFITFANTNGGKQSFVEEEYKIDLSGIRMNCDLEITPETDIQIIFDSQVGDVLKAKGNGNLKLEIDTKGEFKIFGDYTIRKGSYLFTLQNVINKKFDLANGGNIKWDGNPYNATIDIDAMYNVKTTLYDLLLNTPYVDISRKIPVQCNMNLSQNLENPIIKFNIAFPTLDQQTQSILEGLFASEDETNKQILSLLVLNRFYTPEYLRSTDPNFENKNSGYAVGVTTSELLSNQLSNWLSQISNDFDIGVSYRPGDNLTSDEIQFALSTQVFDDKVTINGNIGTSNSQERANDIVGDVDINIKLNKKGKLQLKAFTKSNEYLVYEESRNTQGIGVFYKEDFNTFSGLFKKYISFLRNKEDAEEK